MLIARLISDGHLAFALDHGGHPHLVTNAPPEWDDGAVAERGGVLAPDLCAMATLHKDGRIERTLLPRTEAPAAARKSHRSLYPEPSRLAVMVPKTYFSYSGLLTDGTAVETVESPPR